MENIDKAVIVNKRPIYISKQSEYWKSTNLEDFPVECWRRIDGFPNYRISNYGRVKVQNKQGRGYPAILKQNTSGNKSGYVLIQLHRDNKPKTFQVHRLVAKAFIFNPDNKPCVNHINGIKTDNTIGNLEWVTHRENLIHAVEVFGHYSGVKSGKSKFTEKEVIDIYNDKRTHREIAAYYKVSHSVIGFIKRKQSYKEILNGLD